MKKKKNNIGKSGEMSSGSMAKGKPKKSKSVAMNEMKAVMMGKMKGKC